MRLPSFLGIGAQKGGTTFLHGLLTQHPQVFMGIPKELHFFSLHFQKGFDWYSSHFENATHSQICGEITPYYLFHPLAAERIHAVVPTVKIIILVRDPVDRALSQYFHSRRLNLESLDLKEAFEAESSRLENAKQSLSVGDFHYSHQHHSYANRSRYEVQFRRFEKYFSADQFLILRSESLFKETLKSWQIVCSFLELDACDVCKSFNHYGGKGEVLEVPRSYRDYLRQNFQATYEWMDRKCLSI